MSVKIELNMRALNRLQKNLPQITGARLRALAYEGEAYIKQSFGASPSQPGEPPGVDTGKLRLSIRAEKESTFAWSIATDAEYAPYLEFGTSMKTDGLAPGNVRMRPRPFMGPGLDYIASIAPDRFNGFLEKSL
jgi:hypothetical protein